MLHGTTRHGFTLVELLIVVAIIGVLSTIGVPTYRKMIQKAKQSEAKALLGGLYRAESAFFAEWEAYGGNIYRVGFEVEGLDISTAHGRYPGTYHVGFPIAGCGVYILYHLYPETGAAAAKLAAEFEDYYTSTGYAFYSPIQFDLTGYCRSGSLPPDGSSFRATATGVITSSAIPNSPNPKDNDQWEIDQNRNLAHVYDGAK